MGNQPWIPCETDDVDRLYAEDDLAGLCRDFPDFDRGLIEGMLADQGGDVPEVHTCLRVSHGSPTAAFALTDL